MSSEFFWSLTPREYAAYRKVFEDGQRQHAEDLAVVQWALFTAMGVKRKDNPEYVFTVADFLPEQFRPPKKKQTWQDQLSLMRGFVQQMGERKTG